MIMMDQSKRLSEPLRWTRAGRLGVALVAALLLAVVVGLGLWATLDGSRPGARAGCIEVTFASTLGGATLYACGQRAREVCGSPASNPGAAASTLRQACLSAGYSYGSQGAQRPAGS